MSVPINQQVFTIAKGDGMPHALANLIAAQSRHESGDYTSNVFKNDNNLFGYKFAGQAIATKGTHSPEGDYYAHYATIADSVHELTAWIRRRVNKGVFPSDLTTINTPEIYATLLKKAGYFGDSPQHYIAGLKNHFVDFT